VRYTFFANLASKLKTVNTLTVFCPSLDQVLISKIFLICPNTKTLILKALACTVPSIKKALSLINCSFSTTHTSHRHPEVRTLPHLKDVVLRVSRPNTSHAEISFEIDKPVASLKPFYELRGSTERQLSEINTDRHRNGVKPLSSLTLFLYSEFELPEVTEIPQPHGSLLRFEVANTTHPF
jgi:hypothetical protein